MRIITGGVAKQEVAAALQPLLAADDTVTVGNDMDAAMQLQAGAVDYYMGTCHTGAGASLGVLVGLLGSDRTHTFGRTVPSADAVQKAVEAGNVAFGFSLDQVDAVVPTLFAALKQQQG